MAEREGLFKRLGHGFDRYIGGLLGEDLSKMTPEERALARRQAIGAIGQGMINPANAQPAMANVMQMRVAQRERGELERRQKAAEEEMTRISARLFGGVAPTGQMIEGLEPGEAPTPVTSYYRQDPTDALRRMYGTQAGRDVAQIAPDLAKLAQEGVTGRTVGGAVYNPLTQQFSRPPEISAAAAPVGVPKVSGAAPIAAQQQFRILPPEEAASYGVPEGTVLQQDTRTGRITTLSQVPATERVSLRNRERAVKRVDLASESIQKQLSRVGTGGPMGIVGAASRIFDSQDARQFETFREQLSSAIRSALRIPGEGALSDREQAQYGLTLPSLGLSKDRNIEIMRALENQVRLAADLPTLDEERPQEVSQEDWNMMLPSERNAYKRAGGLR